MEDIPFILPAIGIDESKVVVFGRSLGSIFAMKMASKHPRIAGLIIDSGVASVSSVWGKFIANKGIDVAAVDQCERELVGQQVVMTNYKGMLYFFIRFSLFSPGPSLILHTKDDKLVPFAQNGHQLHEWAYGAGHDSTLQAFDTGGHNYIYDANWKLYCDTLQAFFVNHYGLKRNSFDERQAASRVANQKSSSKCIIC